MTNNTTRRAFLGGAGLATAALIVPAIAATRTAPAGISADLARLIAASDAAKKAQEEYEANVYEVINAEAERQYAAIPHVTVLIDPEAPEVWTTARSGALTTARRFVESDPNHPNIAGFRQLLAAEHQRAVAGQEIRRATGLYDAMQRSDKLVDAWADAQGRVVQHPVSTAADLNAKLAFMIANQMNSDNWCLPYLAADATRLANVEGR